MSERRVLLLAREGMDWRVAGPLAAAGLLPVLSRQLENGTRLSLAGIPPYLGTMQATSLATGCWPHEHGIISQPACDPATGVPLAFSSADRCSPAFWNLLSARGVRHQVIGWPATHPAEPVEGGMVSDAWSRVPGQPGAEWPLPEDAVQPPALAGRLAGCRARMEEIDPRLLGFFLPHATEMNLAADPRVARLVHHLARLYTTHNTAMALLEDEQEARRPWRAFAVFDAFLESVGQDFMGFRDGATGATLRERRWYGAVMEGAYRVHDALLGELLAAAGEDVTLLLVSDRGFKARLPASAGQVIIGDKAPPPGMALVSGPGIVRGGSPPPASILDVTPSLLHLLGLPVGRDMAGRPWFELELPARPPDRIASWAPPCPGTRAAKVPPAERWGLEAAREPQLHLGLCLMAAGRPAKAVGPLYHAMAARPENPLAAYHLALALVSCGMNREAMDALAPLFDFGEDQIDLRQHLLSLAIQCQDHATAARLLGHPGNLNPRTGELRPAFTLLRGLLALHQGDPGLAESCCRTCLEGDPERPEAWLGLARCLAARGEWIEAEAAAQKALGLFGRHPLASLILARAAAHRGDPAAAVFAAETLRQLPDLDHPRAILLKFFPGATAADREEATGLLQQARKAGPPRGSHWPEASTELERARKSTAAMRDGLRQDALPLDRYPSRR